MDSLISVPVIMIKENQREPVKSSQCFPKGQASITKQPSPNLLVYTCIYNHSLTFFFQDWNTLWVVNSKGACPNLAIRSGVAAKMIASCPG